jgi:hypothetical protein
VTEYRVGVIVVVDCLASIKRSTDNYARLLASYKHLQALSGQRPDPLATTLGAWGPQIFVYLDLAPVKSTSRAAL